jgi:hypothetical protein
MIDGYFTLASPANVAVKVSRKGDTSVTVNFYCPAQPHSPSLPQTGGNVNLAPGYWKMYFLGSIRPPASITATASF